MSQQVHFGLSTSASARAKGQARRWQSPATPSEVRHNPPNGTPRTLARSREDHGSSLEQPTNPPEHPSPEIETHANVTALAAANDQEETALYHPPATPSKNYKCSICSLTPEDATNPFLYAVLRGTLSGHLIEYRFDEVSRCPMCVSLLSTDQHEQHWIPASGCHPLASVDFGHIDRHTGRELARLQSLSDTNPNSHSHADVEWNLPLGTSQLQGVSVLAWLKLTDDYASYYQFHHPELVDTVEPGSQCIPPGRDPSTDMSIKHKHWRWVCQAFLDCLSCDLPNLLDAAGIDSIDVWWAARQTTFSSLWYIRPLPDSENNPVFAKDSPEPSLDSDICPAQPSLGFA